MSIDHHLEKLKGVHPSLAERITHIIAAMSELGFLMIVTDGVRTAAQQKTLFDQGRQTLGKIVTNADGFLVKSNHQAHADGFGRAVDCCFLVDGKASWADSNPWELYGAMAKALGCAWGGDWRHIIDRPHVEWKP